MSRPRALAGFRVARSEGDAHDFHHRELTSDLGPAIWIHRVRRPAIVIGSTQPLDVIDRTRATAAGYEVTGRRSGGGIVVVDPAESCWIDVLVPRGHLRWDDDVTRAFLWVGERWSVALEALGVDDLAVHRGATVDAGAGRIVCFAGVGSGEVVVDPSAGARKVVGLSQRRTREIARIQGLYLRRWDPTPIRDFAAAGVLPPDLDLDEVGAGLVARDVDDDTSAPRPDEVIESFLDHFADRPPGD